MYKLPNNKWDIESLRLYKHPTLYLRNYNSHHQEWGYEANYENGETFHDHITNNLYLIYNPKRKGTFRSTRWKKDYSPDLCIISKKSLNEIPKVNKIIIYHFPNSQYRIKEIFPGDTGKNISQDGMFTVKT